MGKAKRRKPIPRPMQGCVDCANGWVITIDAKGNSSASACVTCRPPPPIGTALIVVDKPDLKSRAAGDTE